MKKEEVLNWIKKHKSQEQTVVKEETLMGPSIEIEKIQWVRWWGDRQIKESPYNTVLISWSLAQLRKILLQLMKTNNELIP